MVDRDPPATAFAGELNPAQLDAVCATEGAYLVIAGAGTGKTRTLVYRVAQMVAQGVSPESILLLTFTRRAAQEMLRRASLILDERCNRVAGGTFHSFANLVLRRYGNRLGYDPGFTILDRSDAADLIGILRAEMGYDRRARRFPRKDTILELLSKRVNTHRSLETLLEEDYPQFLDERTALEEIGDAYQTRKREQNVMDYDDLLANLRALLVDHTEVRRELASTYRYVMVDEYQDTNRMQAHIAALLASDRGNLMAVGDDAQSIYSFRGADFRNIMDFTKVFVDCQTLLLEQNYRSTQPILDLGNRILESAKERFEKNLFTEVEGGGKPVFVRTSDDHDQAIFICRRILDLREEGVELSDIAVLSRAAWHTNSLEIELHRSNIPFRKFGGQRFVEAAHVKDLSALLKVALNPLDGSSWFRILQLLEGVGARRAQQMTELVLASGGNVERAFATHFRSARYGESLRDLCTAQATIAEPTDDVGSQISAAIDCYEPLMPKKFDDVKRRMGDLEALLVIAERYRTLESFLTDIAIDPPEVRREGAQYDREDEWMTVSTVHSAKGLEWHAVFVVNLCNGYFPVYNGLNDPEVYEEERRLLYVAATRAKRELYLLKPEQISGRGAFGGGLNELSSLIEDIPGFAELTERVSFSSRREDELAIRERVVAINEERLKRIQDYFTTDE